MGYPLRVNYILSNCRIESTDTTDLYTRDELTIYTYSPDANELDIIKTLKTRRMK